MGLTRQEKMKRRKRKKRIRRTIVLLILFLAAGISFCLFAPVFQLQEMEVAGNEKVSSEEIVAACGIVQGDNIFKIKRKEAEAGIRKIAYIDTAKIKRKLPAKLVITVTESVPAFVVQDMDGYLLLDSGCKVLERIADASAYDLPVLTGLTITNAEPAGKLGIDDPEKFDIIIQNDQLLQAAGVISDVREIDASDILNFRIVLKTGLSITFGKSENMDYKISMLKEVLPQIDQSEGAYLDLRMPEKGFYGKNEASPSPTPSPGG